MSPGCGRSSFSISVFHVPWIKMRPSVPFGALTVSPTRSGWSLIQFGESGSPASERSGRNSIFKYTTFRPALRAAARTRFVGSITCRIAAMSIPAR